MAAEFPADAIAAACNAIKAHLHESSADPDEVIARHAASALAMCEAFTGQAMILREHVERIECAPRWHRLAAAPVASITHVSTSQPAGAAVALNASDFAVDIDARGQGWVRVTAPAVRRAQVTYEAGLAGAWAALPAPVAQGVVLLTAHMLSGAITVPPAAVTALWRPWRRVTLNGGQHARV